jgi:Protein of unknown function (DUF3617)
MRVAVFSLLPLAAAMAACSNAESEAPVDLKPGQYDIIFTGFHSATGTKSHCITAEEASAFPSDPVTRYLPDELRNSCEPQGQRKGNALTGTLSCKFEGSDTASELTLNWTGRMHADSFEITADGALKDLNAPEGASPNRTHATVTGKRTGDCEFS